MSTMAAAASRSLASLPLLRCSSFQLRKKRKARLGKLGPFRCGTSGAGKRADKKADEWRLHSEKSPHGVRVHSMPSMTFASPRYHSVSKQEKKFYPRCVPGSSGPQSRDSPPKRDTGIANEKDWGINLLNENVSESGTSEDGSTWYRESGEELGENGYRCRWTRMGGQCHDGASEWKETVDAFNWIY